MIGQTKSGVVVENEVLYMLYFGPKTEEGLRYSIIYEFNQKSYFNL
jgi:hypothetical protein